MSTWVRELRKAARAFTRLAKDGGLVKRSSMAAVFTREMLQRMGSHQLEPPCCPMAPVSSCPIRATSSSLTRQVAARAAMSGKCLRTLEEILRRHST